MNRVKTAIQAIRLTVEARELMMKGVHALNANLRVARRYKIKNTNACFLCVYDEYQRKLHGYIGILCSCCPLKIVTGKKCGEHDRHYHHDDPVGGLKLIKKVEKEWERRYCHRR